MAVLNHKAILNRVVNVLDSTLTSFFHVEIPIRKRVRLIIENKLGFLLT